MTAAGRILVLAAVLLSAPPAAAQRNGARWDVSLGVGDDVWRAAIARSRVLPSWPLGLFNAGGLIRATAYGGGEVEFTRRGGDAGLPSRLMIDPSIVGLTAGLVLEVPLGGRARAGMNLDLVGLTVGPSRTVAGFDATPSLVALFLYGSADRGSLNSEFYVAGSITPKVELRGGLSHFALGYTVDAGGGPRGRYQRFDDALFIAVRIR